VSTQQEVPGHPGVRNVVATLARGYVVCSQDWRYLLVLPIGIALAVVGVGLW